MSSPPPSPLELRRRAVRRAQARRRAAIAVASSGVALGSLVAAVPLAPGWPVVQATFFNVGYGVEVLPTILEGLRLNVMLTAACSVLISALGLLLALARTSRAAALAPFRLLATAYVDIFRGVPLLLVILPVGFGVPALGLTGVTSDVVLLGGAAVVLTYSAYVAEVFRAGILGINPSQRAAARSLGLTQRQTLRYVVLPRAIRRMLPPLLNDFVALLKDTGLISVLGAIDAIRAAQIESSRTFNYTPYVVAAVLFLMLTVPLTRWTDHVLQRSLARQHAQGNV